LGGNIFYNFYWGRFYTSFRVKGICKLLKIRSNLLGENTSPGDFCNDINILKDIYPGAKMENVACCSLMWPNVICWSLM